VTDILAWLEAHETVLSATAAVVLVLSVSAAVMRSTLARGAAWSVDAVRARRKAWASKSESEVAQPAGATPEAKRTMLAILAADVTGYSRLMGDDERATMDMLDVCRGVFRKHISAHDGYVVDTAGDSVLATFASVVEAVGCAVAVQSDLAKCNADLPDDRKMLFRIGVNLGDVFKQSNGTVYGDGVNVAARLESLADPGGIAVSESAHMQAEGKVDIGFQDIGEHEVKNISRPVRAYRITADKQAAQAAPRLAGTPSRKPSIAVLPFDNMSGDAEQEYFADGMTEDVITLLSTVPGLFVIARNSTFAYKGQATDVRKVAADLGVRYVLEGSVRKAADRIRVTAQFIEAESGNHIWADKYDRDLDDIFAVQDELAQGIVGALQSRLLLAEANLLQRKPPGALDAWGNVVKARIKLFAVRGEDMDEAEPFARRAIEIDPEYGEAHAVLAHILAWRTFNGWTEDWQQTAQDALSHADRALALAPDDPAVLTDAGFARWLLGRFFKSVPILERAVALNPNAALTCALCGIVLSTVDRTDEGFALVEKAFRLSPRDPLEYLFHCGMVFCHFFAGQYEAAKAAADRTLQSHPDFAYATIFRAAACVRLDELEEARGILARVEKAGFGWVIDRIFFANAEGTLWADFTGAIRQAMDREPRT
jgi:adenylate cyclase